MNRHGLIAGATGTGKTKGLQGIAEQLSDAGVPVFAADMKGDLSGLSEAGGAGGVAGDRWQELGETFEPKAFPVEYLAIGGIGPGIPVRATVSDFGPLLLGKVLQANETQEQSLSLVFRYADQKGLPLLDLSDLRALLTFLGSEDGKAELTGIGGVASSTIGVLLRQLVQLEDGGGTEFFGEPQLQIADLLRHDRGRPRDHLVPRAAGSAGQAEPLLDRADVAARRALRGAAGDRRPRQAEARLLLRRGPPAVRRSDEGVPRLDRPDRPADPLQGRRRVLLHAAAEGHSRGRARAARQPDAVRATRVHPGRRKGAEGDRGDVPQVRLLRPRGAAHAAGDRRGRGDDPERERRADTRRAHEDPRAALEDGGSRPTSTGPRRPRPSTRSTARGWMPRARGRCWPRGWRSSRPSKPTEEHKKAAKAAGGGADAVGDFLKSSTGRRLEREVVRGLFGLLSKSLK